MKKKRFVFEYLKGKATNRNGMGMELALLVLLVVFACSTLLVSSALIGKSNLQTQEQQLHQRIALDELAERVLAGDDASLASDEQFADYAVFEKNGDDWTKTLAREGVELNPEGLEDAVLVITDLSGKPLLTVAKRGDKITRWSYN